jgi:hypothetical protein
MPAKHGALLASCRGCRFEGSLVPRHLGAQRFDFGLRDAALRPYPLGFRRRM